MFRISAQRVHLNRIWHSAERIGCIPQRQTCASQFLGRLRSHSVARPCQQLERRLIPSRGCGQQARSVSAAHVPEVDDREMPGPIPLAPFKLEVLRGMGQVVFCNSTFTGTLIIAGLCIGDLQLAGLATVGCASATAAARAVGTDTSTGLMGYNGALVGCAFAVFLPSYYMGSGSSAIAWWTPKLWAAQADQWMIHAIGWNPLGNGLSSIASLDPLGFCFLAVPTAVFAATTALLAGKLGPVMAPVPQLTLAFNFVTLAALAYIRPFRGAGGHNSVELPAKLLEIDLVDWLEVVLNGISQIFVVAHSTTGLAILAGIAVYSPGAAAMAAIGSLLGSLTGIAMGADGDEVSEGLWGYNSALTALAISVFFVPLGGAYYALAAVGAVAASAATAVMKIGIGTTLASPCLTLPFCAVTTMCFLLGGRIPGLVRAAAPHSPEANRAAYRLLQ